MMSHFKAFLLLFSLAVVNSGFATPNFVPTTPAPKPAGESAWILPAPAFVMVVQIGTNWSRITWSPVPGASAYRIITTLVSTGAVVNNTVVSAAVNSAQLEPLPGGATLLSTVYAIDYNGVEGLGKGVQYDTIIIDTVGKYYPPSGTITPTCTLPIWTSGDPGGCPINWNNGNASYFRITFNNNVGYFKTEQINASQMRLSHSVGTAFGFTPGFSETSKVTFGGTPVAVMACYKDANTGVVRLLRRGSNENDPTLIIERIVYSEPLSQELDARNFETVQDFDLTPRLLATPNPFNNQLEIQIPFATTENDLHIALYDPQGRMVLTQQIANGGPIQSIETGHLPVGLYYLRAECAGKSETIKVLKTN